MYYIRNRGVIVAALGAFPFLVSPIDGIFTSLGDPNLWFTCSFTKFIPGCPPITALNGRTCTGKTHRISVDPYFC